jgi:hypothetical protein
VGGSRPGASSAPPEAAVNPLSFLAADRAVSFALDADNPDLSAAAAWNLAMILSAQRQDGIVACGAVPGR